MVTYHTKLEDFRKFHQLSSTFVLPNAWDVMSAKIFEKNGFKAIGTTSAGIAASLGYQDGEQIPFDQMLTVLERIVKAVNVPVSADIEAGYGITVEEIETNVQRIIQTGAVGINIEDGTGDANEPIGDISSQTEKIAAIKERSITSESGLFINARTDIYWLDIGDPSSRFQKTLERVRAYEEAGADCIFIPGLHNKETIKNLRAEISCPINLLVNSDLPSLEELSKIGIERVSTGSAPFRATVTLLEKLSKEINNDQTFHLMTENVLPYGKIFIPEDNLVN
ncbi:isocitrate lyase/PEP mutase family protein [Pseudalkalibacillus salsuginis]|uniref:isocitrate lyase/PEP mutase family protein n=1 Tax=Pseudalkalibacillus salsuginis TaxID=2910972 RepID=UPI001F3EADF6|nr:isocitrate lyase/phosphoenolpyruvate mutase family protein [Pseudalkalibacillus salsuginis]MCF6409780.1 isocitrate lyase/phosphoenolpyruvate mutase family protein [Pseudalkalibacillus salsuginis]